MSGRRAVRGTVAVNVVEPPQVKASEEPRYSMSRLGV
jgi:hypothetical protein